MASNQQQKEDPKEQQQQYKTFMGARVLWPPECADDILEGAIKETQDALKKFEIAREGQKIAEHLKKYMDDHFDPYWHVFFGKNFGCQAVHNKNRFIYFYIEKTAFLMYQTQ
ncbi:hypothetical protein ABPG74_010234 [Tetrahymena malaccensis]